MGKKSGSTPGKRLRELKRLDRRNAKETRRLEAKEIRAKARATTGDEDPDLAGIRPGPQPPPEQWNNPDDE